jgi:hypothetical protein
VYRERFSVVLSVILLVVMGACASGGAGRRSEPSAVDDGAETSFGPTHVVVSNQSWQRVTVYITQGSMLWRLGDVEARSDATLPLKNVGRSLIGSTTYFVARPLAGTPFRSEGFEIGARGGVPIWTIENHTATSFVTIR